MQRPQPGGDDVAASRGMLVLDRFLSSEGSALDLATGWPVRLRLHTRPTAAAPYSTRGAWRLIDSGPRSSRVFLEAWVRVREAPAATAVSIEAVHAALQDARDGCPRALDVPTEDEAQWRRAMLDIAREARLAGFVPVSVGVLGEVLRGHQWRWPRWLADRSLVVFTCDGQVPAYGALGLLRLAGRDARPHLVIRGATRTLSAPFRIIAAPTMVHEDAGVAWTDEQVASPEGLADRAWRRAVEERPADDETAAAARWALMLAPSTDVEDTARAALSVTLAAQGRVLEARAALPEAASGSRPAIVEERVAEACRRVSVVEQPQRGERALADDFLRVLETCQTIEDEQTAIGRVLALLRDRLAAAGVACVLLEREQPRVIAVAGVLAADASVARDVATTGVPRLPRPDRAASDAAWPVRYGGAVIGALWCRWSASLPVRPDDADALMRVTGAALAPAMQASADRSKVRSDSPDIPELVGGSEAMSHLRSAVVRAARSPFSVLIEGESGSGKELVARAIHRMSPRRDRRFCALNCAALGDELAEAELFGHAKGAFTGAVADRTGLFEEATGGTLFLDEVSELSMRVQAKLLRVLQELEVRRIGESHVRPVDTRVVAATNKPLADEAQAGRFRRDLRYRLDVVRLTIPPLRERLEDVPALVRHIWQGLCARTASRAALAPAALAALGRYDWPGNVRELQNVLASLLVSSPPRGQIGASQLPAHVGRTAALGDTRSLAAARREFEVRFVKAALARADGRAALAARDLGLSRQGLAKVMARLGLRSESS
jgi:DNA-binding NtrC family response regulator